MEEVPDMDDLLDEMESDLVKKCCSVQSKPLLPPTSIGMQPRGIKHNPAPRTVVTVSKFVISEDMNEQMEVRSPCTCFILQLHICFQGNINIDTSQLPNTFQTKSSFPPNSDERNIGKENEVSARQEIAHKLKSVHNYSDATNFDPSKKVITQKFSQESEPESEPEPEPEEVSEVEEVCNLL